MNFNEILEPTSTSYENLRNLIFFFKTVKGCTRENEEEEEERLSKVRTLFLFCLGNLRKHEIFSLER